MVPPKIIELTSLYRRLHGVDRQTAGCEFLFSARNFGWSAAPEAIPIPLLPSGPGGVRGTSLHRARSSTLRQARSSRGCKEKS